MLFLISSRYFYAREGGGTKGSCSAFRWSRKETAPRTFPSGLTKQTPIILQKQRPSRNPHNHGPAEDSHSRQRDGGEGPRNNRIPPGPSDVCRGTTLFRTLRLYFGAFRSLDVANHRIIESFGSEGTPRDHLIT